MVYLGRLCGLEDADRIEDAIGRKGDTDRQIGSIVSDNADTILSNAEVKVSKEYEGNAVAEQYARETKKVNLYFMVASSREELGDALRTLAYQPVGEDAIWNIDHNCATAEDYFGGDRVTAMVIEMPDDKYAEAVAMGKIGTGEGTYEVDGETSELPEALLGDRVLRDIIQGKDGRVLMYDDMHTVLGTIGTPINTHKIPRGRKSPIRINNLEKKPHVVKPAPKTNGLNAEQQGAIDWAREQLAKGTFSRDEIIGMLTGVVKNPAQYLDNDDTPTA